MRAADQVQIVLLQELGHAVWAKSVADTTIVLSPALCSKRGRQVGATAGEWVGRGHPACSLGACEQLSPHQLSTNPPSHLHILVGVGPQQVAQQSGVWNIRGARDALDLLQRLELRGKTTVHAQDLHSRRAQSRSIGFRQTKPSPDLLPPMPKRAANAL